MKSRKLPILIIAGLVVLVIAGLLIAHFARKGSGSGSGGIGDIIDDVIGPKPPPSRTLDFDAPQYFLSSNVERAYSTSKAISKPGVIRALEGASLSIQTHPHNPDAQLRVIQLPKSYLATKDAARILAKSGAIQECDVMVVFRPEWAGLNGYGNLQLGITHSALATIKTKARIPLFTRLNRHSPTAHRSTTRGTTDLTISSTS